MFVVFLSGDTLDANLDAICTISLGRMCFSQRGSAWVI